MCSGAQLCAPECPNIKNKNSGLDQYGAEPFEWQQFGTAGIDGVKATWHYTTAKLMVMCPSVCVCSQNEVLNSMRSDIQWIRNRVSSLVDNLNDQLDVAVNTSPSAAQGLSPPTAPWAGE